MAPFRRLRLSGRARLVVRFTNNCRVARLQEQVHFGLAWRARREAWEAASLLAKRCSREKRAYLVNLQSHGVGCLFVSSSYSFMRHSSSCKLVESFGVRIFRCNSEKYTSTWLSQ